MHIHEEQITLCTAFHEQFKRSVITVSCLAHSVFEQCAVCLPAPATHDQSLLQNNTVAVISINCQQYIVNNSVF